MSKILTLYLILLTCIAYTADFTRSELLDEGRRSINTLEAYKRLSSPEYTNIYLGVNSKFFIPYEIETVAGDDNIFILLAELDGKIKLSRIITTYFILNYYGLFSLNRFSLDTKKNGSGTTVADRDDGYPQFSRLNYGYIFDIYTGADIRIWKFFMIQTGLIFSIEKLKNAKRDTRNIEGISEDENGNPLYMIYTEREKFTVLPVIGLYILDVHLFSFQSVVAFSSDTKKVTMNENLLTLKFEKYVKNAGRVVTGSIIYPHFNEYGIVFRWENVFEKYNIGFEYYAKRDFFSEIFFEYRNKFHKTITRKRVKIKNSFGNVKQKIKINNLTEKSETEKNNSTLDNNADIENPSDKKLPNNLNIIRKPKVRYRTYINKSFFYYLIRINLARTGETIEISNSQSFVLGGKLALGYKNTGFASSGIFFEISIFYNVYRELIIFRRSLDKFGLGGKFGFHF